MSSLRELADDLNRDADTIDAKAAKVVGQGCLNIKKQTQQVWRARLRGNLQHLWRAVSYDVTEPRNSDIITGSVGPVLTRKQGPLGGVAEEGTPNNAPIPALGPALLKETPRFIDHLGDAAELLK
jgi:hypothetical protein